jgi:hypothetical protein
MARFRYVRTALMLAVLAPGACARAAATEGTPPVVVAQPATPTPSTSPRSALLARLARLTQAGQFLFGQENGTVWGMSLDGRLVSTKAWYDHTAAAGKFTSDVAAVTGDDPAVLGVSLGMLAYEPVEWNRRPVIAAAIRHQLAAGGVVTMDWHVPSCNSSARATDTLDIVVVDGRAVVIPVLGSGSSFYTEEEYTRPIASRADVPDTLKCACQIANDRPLSAGFHQGTSGKTWLIAQAKHAAKVLREQKLADAPIIVRPFHEQTGSWFWWGQPYWNCAALLGQPDAITGAEAFKVMNRIYIEALRAEPGMGELLFAYSPDKLSGLGEDAVAASDTPRARARFKLDDPSGYARDRLRERVVREMTAAGLSYVSPAQARVTVRASRAVGAKAAGAYVAQRRPYYVESYAGDDLFDVLGIDLYHPIGRAADDRDRRQFGLLLRVLAEEARAHGKPYALTEAGTYRLPLSQIAAAAAPGAPLTINGQKEVDTALALLFEPADRAELLRHFGLRAPGPVVLSPAERTMVIPRPSEDWFNQQLLPLAKAARVAYAMVWQTYYDDSWRDRFFYYYVPYPAHPAASALRRFHDDPATCFLRDRCAQ